MRPKSNKANLCVSLSIKGWPCFTALRPFRLVFMPTGWKPRPGKVATTFLAIIGNLRNFADSGCGMLFWHHLSFVRCEFGFYFIERRTSSLLSSSLFFLTSPLLSP
jgi:hypothetical protein